MSGCLTNRWHVRSLVDVFRIGDNYSPTVLAVPFVELSLFGELSFRGRVVC